MNTNLNPEVADIVDSWQIPPIGFTSAAPMPAWLVDRWMHPAPDDQISFNGFGGLTRFTQTDQIVLYPEDWIHLLRDNTIQFCTSDATP